MVEPGVKEHEVSIGRFDFAVRLRSLFFPFDFNDIVSLLRETGFTLLQRIRDQVPAVPTGGRLVVSGVIAEKEGTGLLFRQDPQRGVVGIRGRSIEETMSVFDQIEAEAENTFGVVFRDEARFYELIAEATIQSQKSPIETVGELFADSRILGAFRELLGEEVANFGVRLARRRQRPDQDEWFEYRVEPMIAKPTSFYVCQVVHRSPNKEEVRDAAMRLQDRLADIVSAMEG